MKRPISPSRLVAPRLDLQNRQNPCDARVLDAETRASQWLADANEAREHGNMKRAAECDAKSQSFMEFPTPASQPNHRS
jgi:hypothetical protein